MKKIAFLAILLAALIVTNLAAGGRGQAADPEAWPTRDVSLVVAFMAGSDADINTRALARGLESRFNVRFPITNVAGGNASIGMGQVMGARPDGYTFVALQTASLMGNVTTGLVDFCFRDMAPVAIFGRQAGETIIVPADSPYRTFNDLISATRARPDTIRLAIVTGGAVYIASVIMRVGGAQFLPVEGGDGPARILQVLGGHADATIAPYSAARSHIEAGTIRPLATLLAQAPSRIQPPIQPAHEVIPNLIINTLFCILGPKGTDPRIIEKFNAAILDVVNNDADFREGYARHNFQDAWALNVADTVAEMERQRANFMQFQRYLK